MAQVGSGKLIDNPHDLGVPHDTWRLQIEKGVGYRKDLQYRASSMPMPISIPKVILGDTMFSFFTPSLNHSLEEQHQEWNRFLDYAIRAFLDADWISYAEIDHRNFQRKVEFVLHAYDPWGEKYARVFGMTYMELRDLNHVYDKFNFQFRLSKQWMRRATCVNPE